MRKLPAILVLSLAICGGAAAHGQRDPSYDYVVVPQTRIDARDLGYSPDDLVPDGESGITSLSMAPDGNIFGATSGLHSHLFVINPQHGYVVPVGVIPDAKAVTQALVISATGRVFLGVAPSGHLLEYVPHDLENLQIEIGKPLPVVDHGVPVSGESISALTIDRKRNFIYGLTAPNAHLFKFSIADHNFTDLGIVAKDLPWGEKFEHEKMLSRMLVVDQDGNVFVSGENGAFYRFVIATGTLENLTIHAPAVPGREPYTRVDTFLADDTGMIYGGTSDGYLFRLDPQKLTVTNLGKPLNQYHIAGLAKGIDGKLYGVGGDTSEMARMFSFDPSTGAYELLGFIDVNRRPYYTWQAYVIGAVVSDKRGTIYFGEDERISKLYLFYP
jgi:outer membrane protein assembly factor BamB